MLGHLIGKIREDKNISKTDLSSLTGINVGHLTHIEKGERNPSHKSLRLICDSLKVPYQPLFHTYDKDLTKEQEENDLINSIYYDRIPLIDSIDSFIKVPSIAPDSSLAFKMTDDAMKTSIPKGSICFLEYNTIPLQKEFGLFEYKNELIVRRILYKKNKIVLKSDGLFSKDITIIDSNDFYIIGKIIVDN